MATIEENLRKIRGEAIYGPDVREAIAQGIEQAGGPIFERIAEWKQEVRNTVSGYESTVTTAINSYKSTVTTTVNSYKSTVTTTVNSYKSTVTTTVNSYKSDVNTAVSSYKSRLDTIEHDIETEDLFIEVVSLGGNDYKAVVTGSAG